MQLPLHLFEIARSLLMAPEWKITPRIERENNLKLRDVPLEQRPCVGSVPKYVREVRKHTKATPLSRKIGRQTSRKQ